MPGTRLMLWICWGVAAAAGADPVWESKPFAVPAVTRGAMLRGGELFVWGEGLWSRPWRAGGHFRERAKGSFAAAGCRWDINEDGAEDWILEEGGRLVWLAGPDFRQRQVIDTGSAMSDCLGTTLLGHRGILVAYRGLQVRFYERGAGDGERWPYSEIYSFYTASYQGGLALRDVDGDGRVDIYSGNYWIRSPESFELPWRLYAIETYNDMPEAANLALAPLRIGGRGPCLVVSQKAVEADAKLASFCTGASIFELWREQRLDEGLHLQEPAALAVGDLNGDDRDDFVVGERAGEGRVWVWLQREGWKFERHLVSAGHAVHTLLISDENADGSLDVVGVGRTGGMVWRNPRLQ